MLQMIHCFKHFLLTSAIVATAFASANAQQKTYNGSYPLVFGSGDGFAIYSYIENDDRSRIYNGRFELRWDNDYGNGCLSGKFDRDRQVGEWVYSNQSSYGDRYHLNVVFENGVLNGPCKYETFDDGTLTVRLNFTDGIIDGPFTISHKTKRGSTDMFLQGKVVKGHPIGDWEYIPHTGSHLETSLHFFGDNPDAPNMVEVCQLDQRTGDLTKQKYDLNHQLSIPDNFIPNIVNDDFIYALQSALNLIDKATMRGTNKRPKLNVTVKSPVDENKVFTHVEQMPAFPGGDAALLSYLGSHIRYPQDAADDGIEGQVVVRFVVTKTGKVGEVQVLRGKHPSLDKEAMRVVKTLPAFTPGKMNGNTVNVWYTLPVRFKLAK